MYSAHIVSHLFHINHPIKAYSIKITLLQGCQTYAENEIWQQHVEKQ